MNKITYKQFPIIGRLVKVTLTNSSFELTDPFQSLEKGVISLKNTVEIGIKADTFDEYFVWIETTIFGKPTAQAEKPAFTATCKMLGRYTVEEKMELSDKIITQAAEYRGAMQIYPMIRMHLLNMVRLAGIRINIPLEYDITKKTELAASTRAKKESAGKHKVRRGKKE